MASGEDGTGDPAHYLRGPTLVYGALGLGMPCVAVALSLHPLAAGACWSGGWILFTFVEYVFHRFVQHRPGRRRFLRGWDDHGRHHVHPDDPEDFVFLLRESLPPAVLVVGLLTLLIPIRTAGLTVAAGFLSGYLMYEWVHMAAHAQALADKVPWLGRWSMLHARHHYDRASAFYGFLTTFWDRLLGTYPYSHLREPFPQRHKTRGSAPNSAPQGSQGDDHEDLA